MKLIISILLAALAARGFAYEASGQTLLVPMDEKQENHLKAYGLAYWALANGTAVEWLLNYRGGAFAMPYNQSFRDTASARGVSAELHPPEKYTALLKEIAADGSGMDAVKLEKAPKVAVYAPGANQPWNDAVTLVLTYAEIPYEQIYDNEILLDTLANGRFDWLHLHHEDFTGQYGKYWAHAHDETWYKAQKFEHEATARAHGFQKVSKMKLAVALKIREFAKKGGFLFAMCSGADTYDVALAAANTDICGHMYDGDGRDPNCQSKLDYSQTLAFHNFKVEADPAHYEHSDVDVSANRKITEDLDYFRLASYSAKWDPAPCMLCQNHTSVIKGFMGQTTGFRKRLVKPGARIMGEVKGFDEARYIHGNIGKGMWTFYSGHDPEDYIRYIDEPPTDLSLHPNSPGYRLILNNVLFPSARKIKQRT